MKILFLHHPYVRPRFEWDFVEHLRALPEFDVAAADLEALKLGRIGQAPGEAPLAAYDAVVLFVAFAALRRAEPLDWDGFRGLRIMFEHDAIQNYSDLFDATLQGAWPPVFARHRFDVMITSGLAVQRKLMDDNIRAIWLPKAYEHTRFCDAAGERAEIASYGSGYLCRLIAERALLESGMPLRRIPMTPYPELGVTLQRFLACMAVSSDLLDPPAFRATLEAKPAMDIEMRPGLEPMAKLFEAAGAGCAPIADAMTDLPELGFVDGENILTFRSHAELVEKTRWWHDRPHALRRLGVTAAQLVAQRHTWAHRAIELRDLLRNEISL